MEFFESLYKGFEAEHYVAGKLFSVGYEAFKLPGDFGFAGTGDVLKLFK
jgi:hypothetical protein